MLVCRGYYMVARRYEFYVRVGRLVSHSFTVLTREILCLPREHKIHIFSPPGNILHTFFRSELARPYDLPRSLGYHPTPAFSVVPDSPECSVLDLAPASRDKKPLCLCYKVLLVSGFSILDGYRFERLQLKIKTHLTLHQLTKRNYRCYFIDADTVLSTVKRFA